MHYRNIAIIAHVDHGKTTLVDALLKQSGTFRENEDVGTTIMDSNDQEKNVESRSMQKIQLSTIRMYKINIVDTPGHADFGSEVERVLRMVDSVCLVVDAYEGPMPQTKFVLKKALELGLKPLVLSTRSTSLQLNLKQLWICSLISLYNSVRLMSNSISLMVVLSTRLLVKVSLRCNMTDERTRISLHFLIRSSLRLQKQQMIPPSHFRMQIANLAYDNYVGRMGIGRVYEGTVKVGQSVTIIANDGDSPNRKDI
jgi:GTP-binding protein